MAVHAAHVRSANAHNGVLHRGAGLILGRLHRLLNSRDGFIQIDDHALARPARLRHSVAAIAQAALRDLHHEGTRLRAAHINRRQNVSLLIRHPYEFPELVLYLRNRVAEC